jgi:hypothetical protein
MRLEEGLLLIALSLEESGEWSLWGTGDGKKAFSLLFDEEMVAKGLGEVLEVRREEDPTGTRCGRCCCCCW